MSKASLKNKRELERVNLALKKALKEVLAKKTLNPIGEDLVKDLKIRTRLGYGVQGNRKSQKKLKPIKKSTKLHRRRLKRRGELSNETTPARSNLTMTGKMLDSLNFTVLNKKIKIRTDVDYAKYHQDGDRPFLFLTKDQARNVEIKTGDILKKLVEKYL